MPAISPASPPCNQTPINFKCDHYLPLMWRGGEAEGRGNIPQDAARGGVPQLRHSLLMKKVDEATSLVFYNACVGDLTTLLVVQTRKSNKTITINRQQVGVLVKEPRERISFNFNKCYVAWNEAAGMTRPSRNQHNLLFMVN